MSTRRITTRVLLAIAALVALAAPARAGQPPVNVTRAGLGAGGYDVVAYMTEGRAVEGQPAFETSWNGARWRFASAEHRDLFLRDPAKYAPQFGGYCAWAVSRGYTADGDPEAWSVVDGKLYLNYSKRVRDMWSRDIPGNIAKGRANWPKVLDK